MKNYLKYIISAVVFLLIAAAVVTGCIYCYNHVPDFRNLFGPGGTEVLGNTADVRQTLAQRSERAGLLALYLFAGIVVLQILMLFIAVHVFGNIRKNQASPDIKLAQIANADIFLDLPLYIGLFGSVSSFMVMSFSSSSGQLIAYSSTLIGILFCTIMRVCLMYPLKSKLIAAVKTAENSK
ncbi:MAG: hypothetical protein E7056_01640 [Lentisphaerae bacterium]|nr:hypothetical protein [Lentisphaerota bacterium]